MEEIEKKCTKCGELLPLSMFYSKTKSKDGHMSQCKNCLISKQKKYYNDHKDERKMYQKTYNKNHYNEILERGNKWWRDHPEQSRRKKAKRRSLIKKTDGDFTNEQWQECLLFFNNTCAYSNETFAEELKERLSIDHVVPLDNGGSGYIWNIVPAKQKYNSSKKSKNMLKWYTIQPFYSNERLNKIYEWQQYAYEKWGYLQQQAM